MLSRKQAENLKTFERELQAAINRNSIDNAAGCPDFILSRYMMGSLLSLLALQNDRYFWGRIPSGE